jgi:DHA1 family multidrug resistance protein-like MFS transporter
VPLQWRTFLQADGALSGRRPVFLWTFLLVVLFQIGEALAKNIATLLVCRFFSGVFAASPITNAGGVVADIWDPVGRGAAMAVVGFEAWDALDRVLME